MNKPYIYEGSITHQVGSVILENNARCGDVDLEQNTFIHAIVDEEWQHLGGIWLIGGQWYYYIPSSNIGWTDKGRVECGTALEGINIVLRRSGAVA